MPPCSHFSTPHGSRSVFRCLHIPGLRCFHQGGSGATNGCGRGGERRNHERHGKPRNHEWTRMDTKKLRNHEWLWAVGEEPRNTRKNSEPRMDTNGHEKNSGTTNGHEWTRMTKTGVNHEIHEIREKTQEPRMDTNGHLEGDKGDKENTAAAVSMSEILRQYKRICKKRRRGQKVLSGGFPGQ